MDNSERSKLINFIGSNTFHMGSSYLVYNSEGKIVKSLDEVPGVTISITINCHTYEDDSEWYYIDYSWKYDKSIIKKDFMELYLNDEYARMKTNYTIKKNSFTQELIKLLLAPMDEWKSHAVGMENVNEFINSLLLTSFSFST